MRQTHIMIAALALIASLAGCAQFPELDGTIAPDTPNNARPALIPLAALVARANTTTATAATATTNLSPRIGSLNNRATRLRGPVIDPATRARMLRGVR